MGKIFGLNINWIYGVIMSPKYLNNLYSMITRWRGVAQLGSAGALGALGRRFESCRPDQL